MRLGFRQFLAGSPRQQAESSSRWLTQVSRYYGRDVRLRLLSTSPLGNAVTFDYEEPDAPRRGLAPRQCNDITGALGRPSQAVLDGLGRPSYVSILLAEVIVIANRCRRYCTLFQ